MIHVRESYEPLDEIFDHAIKNRNYINSLSKESFEQLRFARPVSDVNMSHLLFICWMNRTHSAHLSELMKTLQVILYNWIWITILQSNNDPNAYALEILYVKSFSLVSSCYNWFNHESSFAGFTCLRWRRNKSLFYTVTVCIVHVYNGPKPLHKPCDFKIKAFGSWQTNKQMYRVTAKMYRKKQWR